MSSFSVRYAVTFCLLLAFSINSFAQTKAFDLNRLDTSADACEDFYQYANGGWLKNTEIPASQARWGSFNILNENNNNTLKEILENAAKTKSPAGSSLQLIGDFYSTCVDEDAIEKAGTTALAPYFQQINNIKDVKSLQKQIAAFHSMGIGAIFGFGVFSDAKNSSMNAANANQGGLSLPTKDYYLKDDAKSVETRAKFVEHVANMFKLLGDDADKAAANAKTVLDFQTRLAKASMSPVELRDPEKNYNKMDLAKLAAMSPNFSWTGYLINRGIPQVKEVIVGQPAFFTEVSKMMTEVPLEQWKTNLRWNLITSTANRLPKAFVDENFNFFGKYLNGQKEMLPRWRRCSSATDGNLGEALGQEFVKKAYTPAAKKKMDEMIDNLFAAYRERINNLDWMSAETKTKALAKLGAMKRKIGYPDKLRGYVGLKIDRTSYLSNTLRSAQFQIARNLKDVNTPVDKSRWGMTPPTVNAGYFPVFNDVTFPAGILQPPFFNFAADDPINYGAIGGGIGHEITHGFDDEGSQYDGDGNLKSWWTPEDREKFEARANCVVEQFNGYEVQPGLFINGKLTLGENIGDLGGLILAYNGYKKSMQGKPQPEKIDGFTPEQRFFLGWAQVWAAKSTPQVQRVLVASDPHSDPRFRVNGPFSNLPEFAQAFGCKVGQKMVRPNPCKIW
ncbi:MAG: M13 family metallopeptidase [Pyrinomonadaceae bacterium]|nr:M13 family metallopeptidase [Pyrinomonadaceae bacterium]